MSKKQVKHESYQDSASVVRYLEEVIDGLNKGHIILTSGSDVVDLEPNGLIQMQINATQRKSRHQLSVKLQWMPKDAAQQEDSEEPLTIKTD